MSPMGLSDCFTLYFYFTQSTYNFSPSILMLEPYKRIFDGMALKCYYIVISYLLINFYFQLVEILKCKSNYPYEHQHNNLPINYELKFWNFSNLSCRFLKILFDKIGMKVNELPSILDNFRVRDTITLETVWVKKSSKVMNELRLLNLN